MEIGLEQLIQLPGFAVLVWIIVRQEKRDDRKDATIKEILKDFTTFSNEFSRQSTLLDVLVHSKRGGSHDEKN